MFWITKAAIPHLPPGATIINTSLVNAYEPSENLLDYAATKAVIANFSKGLAKQVAKQGIRVNAGAPGLFFWTPLQVSGGQTQEKLAKFGADSPLGCPGQPAEIATVYVELASAEASYITGRCMASRAEMEILRICPVISEKQDFLNLQKILFLLKLY